MAMKTEKLEFRGGNYMSLLPFAVFIITLICCFTGIGRTFEGRNGEEIKSKTRPQL